MDPNVANPISTEHIRAILTLLPSVTAGLHATSEKTREAIEGLPYIQEDELVALGEKDNACPICIVPFLALLAEEEMARAMDSPAHPVEELGVTRLVGDGRCGHVFCRKDLSKWILSGKNTCPLCRQPLFKAEPERTSSSRAPDAANPGNTNDAPDAAVPNDAADADELTDFRAQFDRHMQEFMRQAAGEGHGQAAPHDAASASASAETSVNEPSSSSTSTGGQSSTRGTGGIARDLGESHAQEHDEDDEDELASMLAGMNPEDAQRMRATMAAMQSMFSSSMPMGGMFGMGAGQRRREERDDDRDEYSGMYS